MSRLGKKPVAIPQGVTVTVAPGNVVTVKGTKGSLSRTFSPEMSITVDKDQVTVGRASEEKRVRALHGTTRVLISNMIRGVTAGFEKELEVTGVGYRFSAQGNNLQLAMGYSHPVDYSTPQGIKFALEGQIGVKVQGLDKQLVGQVAAEVRGVKGPEPYKGKGIRYKGEHIIRKAGKAGKGAGGAAGAAK